MNNNNFKELIKIAKEIQLINTGDNLRKILSKKNIFALDITSPDQLQNQIKNLWDDYDNENISEEKQKQLLEQLQKKIQEASQIKNDISNIRKEMSQDVKNWDKCLWYIYSIFIGKDNDAFPKAMKALGSSEYFQKIGLRMMESFENAAKQTKKYNINKMDFNKFKELADDEDSGYMDNLIMPFVDMYNRYMDTFEQLEKKYKEVQTKQEKQLEKVVEENQKLNTDSNDQSSYPEKITKKERFSKKTKLAKQLIDIAKIIATI